jgi:hypothetical protein
VTPLTSVNSALFTLIQYWLLRETLGFQALLFKGFALDRCFIIGVLGERVKAVLADLFLKRFS